jgi:hypothetical protein
MDVIDKAYMKLLSIGGEIIDKCKLRKVFTDTKS